MNDMIDSETHSIRHLVHGATEARNPRIPPLGHWRQFRKCVHIGSMNLESMNLESIIPPFNYKL